MLTLLVGSKESQAPYMYEGEIFGRPPRYDLTCIEANVRGVGPL